MKKDGVDIFLTKGGYCRRFPEGIVGPFKTKQEAENAYFVKKEGKKEVFVKTEKKKKEEVIV